MARWEVAYDALTDVYQWSKSSPGQRYLEGWADSMGRGSSYMKRAISDGLAERTVADLFNAEPFYVDDDMQTLWEAAVPGFEQEPLRPTDLPTPSGFIYLPRPFHLVDLHGKAITTRAFLWTERSITFTGPLGDLVRGQIPMSMEERERSATFERPGITLVAFHQLGDPDDYDADNTIEARHLGLRPGMLLLDHAMPWVYSATYPQNDRSIQKPFQCLLRLMQQTIATRSEERPSKPFRSRWRKAGLEDERRVVVVRLRRHEQADSHEPTSVEWSHRWIVSGHWRRQFYPSLGEHRQIWISAFVKGPPELELVVRKARVWEVVQ